MAVDLERDRVVRTDMERVFRPLAGRALTPVYPTGSDRNGGSRRGEARAGGGARPIGRAVLALVVLLVAASAVLYGATRSPGDQAAFRRADTQPERIAAPREASGIITPAAYPGLASDSDPLADGSQAPSTADADPAAAPAPGEAAASTAPRTRSASPVVVAALSDRRPRRERTGTPPTEADCPPGSLDDRCIYQDVLRADARLLAAYERATRDGVPTGELRAVRRRWLRAREVSLDAPDETIRRYDGLADELDGLRRDEGR